jgi:hypothetical protein
VRLPDEMHDHAMMDEHCEFGAAMAADHRADEKRETNFCSLISPETGVRFRDTNPTITAADNDINGGGCSGHPPTAPAEAPDERVQELVAMGFDPVAAARALRAAGGDPMRAVERLLARPDPARISELEAEKQRCAAEPAPAPAACASAQAPFTCFFR